MRTGMAAMILTAALAAPGGADEVARYTFDGPLGTEDSVGTHNGVLEGARGGATIVNSADSARGMVLSLDNPTVSFNDNAQRMSVADSADFQFTGAMTVALWMEALQPDVDKTQSRLLTKRMFPPDYSLQVSTAAKDLRTQTRSMPDTHTPADSWTYDTWHHVAMVYDYSGTGTCVLYVDGEARQTVTISANLATSTWGVTIGATPDNGYATAYAFHGYLDDVRFFNAALSQVDIQALMGPPPPAAAHPGDANRDNVVDLQDFGALKDHFGAVSGATWEMGDFNADSVIDLQDFGILKDHFGHTTGDSPLSPVPEPASAAAILLGLGALLRRR